MITLPNGKITHCNHNGYTYIGDVNNHLAQIANYSDITSLQTAINNIQNTLPYKIGVWNPVDQYQDFYEVDFEPSAIIFFCCGSSDGTVSSNGGVMSFASHTMRIMWKFTSAPIGITGGVSSIRGNTLKRISNISQWSSNPLLIYIAVR